MAQFFFRTEDIKDEDILSLFVSNHVEREIVDLLKSPAPTILEGSRGTGKSFLMKVAAVELDTEFESARVLPVYLSFNASSLVNTNDPLQFRHWMLAKLIRQILKQLQKKGVVVNSNASALLGSNSGQPIDRLETEIENLVTAYEQSYRNPGQHIDADSLPDISDVKDAIEELCESQNIERMCIFFDEAAHVFRPEQQRQFFTLFRDLRSPYISCNAAVYPGVTHYGPSFELTHDATFRRIERDVLDPSYLDTMKNMVYPQLENNERAYFDNQASHFNTLAYASGGNPRVLFKTISRCAKLSTSEIESVVKNFYRSDIWAEHTSLGEKYRGHQPIVDWGRNFIENLVVSALQRRNEARLEPSDDRSESSIYFWIHKDAPEIIKESLRLLTYTGVIRKIDEGVRASRSDIGTRYEVKYGCVVSRHATPLTYSVTFRQHLALKRFLLYGANHSAYAELTEANLPSDRDERIVEVVRQQLEKSIDVLDLTQWQKQKLHEANVLTVGLLLDTTEDDLISNIFGVGPVRARTMKNAAVAELLEYISG